MSWNFDNFKNHFTFQVWFMHAHVFSVSFPCVNLKCKGSRRPQDIKRSREKSRFFTKT